MRTEAKPSPNRKQHATTHIPRGNGSLTAVRPFLIVLLLPARAKSGIRSCSTINTECCEAAHLITHYVSPLTIFSKDAELYVAGGDEFTSTLREELLNFEEFIN